ncbi:MAG TPA: hypothetical protein VN699_15235 [Pirellulales bacterium]|nr:hypothetical protein [Pirellulales bacterium]
MPRLRFSLKALFLFLLVATLAASNVFTSYRLKQSRDQNAKLRTELGYLTIEDPGKLNVVQIATHEDLEWQWRLHVPEGSKLVLKGATHEIPEHGLPAESGRLGLQSGEHLVTAAVRRDHLNQWQLRLAISGTTTLWPFPETAKWLNDKAGATGWLTAGGGRTETKKPGKPLRLLRVLSQTHLPPGISPTIRFDDDLPRGKSNRIGDGLTIWIDEATQEESRTFWP